MMSVGHGGALVELVAFDFEALQQANVAARVNDLPMRRRRVGRHEIL
jgi:hypothetical protein